jgi:hypothetical protein
MADEMVKAHRIEIDINMTAVKKEVQLLHLIEGQEIPIDDWVV